MPEGPEVRRHADRIAAAIEGQPLEDIFFAFDYLQPFEDHLRGAHVEAVETRGKAFIIRFQGGMNLYVHLQLYGRWYVVKRGTTPRTNRSLRVALHAAEHSALLYSASDVELLPDEALSEQKYLAKLGPDLLSETLTPGVVSRRLRDLRFHRRSLAALYLDQSFIAGVGNYLRSEILFRAGVLPTRRPKDLTANERRRLSQWTVKVGRQAYEEAGVTNDLRRVQRLKAQGLTRREYRHFVFARDDRDCWVCGRKIERQDLAGRRVYWCPNCQA